MSLKIKILSSLTEVTSDEWNEVVDDDYPFLRYEFLSALEQNGCACAATGWEPRHVLVQDEGAGLIAVIPSYLKSNSYGEYVFDWGWADAYHRHGLEYYPKLLSAIPFTPCVGPRIAIKASYSNENDRDSLIGFVQSELISYCQSENISSWHLLFPEQDQPTSTSIMQRTGVQYHWYNRGYESFDDYLQAMSSRKRKSVKKERLKIAEQSIEFERTEGADISDEQLKQFYVYYQATYMKRGQRGYLSFEFFADIQQSMPEHLFLVMAKNDSKYVAAALFFKGGDTLYGRYWGCLEEYDQLHFETCYYQGIDYAIENGLMHFDSGAQGEHKIQRGFEPIFTHSWHWIAHPEFSAAIRNFVEEEAEHMVLYREEAAKKLPFKQE